jgi:hypothetical protein
MCDPDPQHLAKQSISLHSNNRTSCTAALASITAAQTDSHISTQRALQEGKHSTPTQQAQTHI